MNKIKSFYGERNFFYIKSLLLIDLFYLISNFYITNIYGEFLDSLNIYLYLGALFFVISLIIIAVITISALVRKSGDKQDM